MSPLFFFPFLCSWKADIRIQIPVLGDEFIHCWEHLEAAHNFRDDCLDLEQSKLLSNAVPWSSTEGQVLKGTGFLLLESLGVKAKGILEGALVIAQHYKSQIESGSLGYYSSIYKKATKIYIKIYK